MSSAYIKLRPNVDPPFCPGRCKTSDLNACLLNGHKCSRQQYCHVTKDVYGDVFASVSVVSSGHVDVLSLLKPNVDPPFCPGRCKTSDLNACLLNGHKCSRQQYCHVTKDVYGDVFGVCKSNLLHTKCINDMMSAPCGAHQHRISCVQSCCASDKCLQNHGFGATTTTQIPRTTTPTAAMRTTPTPPPTTTSAPSQSLYARFKTSCKDQLEAGVCSVLKTAEDVCHKELSVDLCPETCGICQVITDANCHDTVLNNGCHDMYVSKGICGDPLAKYTCPASCGMCDSVVSKLIQDLIEGKNTPPPQPATTTAAATTTALSCSSLAGMPCDQLLPICTDGDMGDQCPNECGPCF
ncbi:uncharacterized protein LOC106013033 [Aplysia californica]|uniref:Uncharacterized protein LOC106013033 n=1 Tax=Aplysia californica TaxID=6500 RepID=A0ABM1W0F3_APLCA|nr:uncharacterized protein LOC106013033 [Aplysia californica]